MREEAAVSIKSVTKEFLLPHQKSSSIKSLFLNPFTKYKSETQLALNDISFDINKGEFFGIVGRNGSGKSTLLKCMAGVYTPDRGRIKHAGKLVPFIELGVGFNPELSGRDNVYLNAALFGFNRAETDKMYDKIVEFAELENFMDQKLKNYSSGMQVRLAFSIAIQVKGDILLLDEVLAVGDAAFQQKCFDYFQELKDSNITVIFVSHDRAALERFCDRGVLIDKGRLVAAGPIIKVLNRYNKIILDELDRGSAQEKERAKQVRKKISSQQAKIIEVSTYTKKGKIQRKFLPGENAYVRFSVKIHKRILNPILGVTIWEKNVKQPVFATNTLIEGNRKTGDFQKNSTIYFSLELPTNLNDGEYHIEPAIANESGSVVIDQISKASTFYINGNNNPYSLLSSENQINLSVKE